MEKTGGSRLLQIQARFQQKQMQERELKIASLYEAQQARALDRVRHSPSGGTGTGKTASPPAPPPVPVNPGKVRQMFEERRTKAGIDKSYPLQPIHNVDRQTRKTTTNGFAAKTSSHTSTTTRVTEKKSLKTSTSNISRNTVKKTHRIENTVNGSGDLNHNHEPDMNTAKRELPQSNGEVISSLDKLDADNNYLLENETFPEALAPLPTPRSPEPKEPKRPPRRSPANRSSPTPKPQPALPPRRVTSEKIVAEKPKARGAMQRSTVGHRRAPEFTTAQRRAPVPSPQTRQGPSVSTKRADESAPGSARQGVPCGVCGRRFAADRVAKHEDICRRSNTKKRKPFDALKHRLQGTEAEPFIGKIKKQHTTSSAKINTQNNNWRLKHQEFITAIRAAKQVQAHLNAGGKLSDLPPPPPSENPDYIQCPHCNRRFNQAAAERHIPKCANYSFNKPKPNNTRKR